MRWYFVLVKNDYSIVAYVRSKNKKEALKKVINFYKSKGYDKDFLRRLKQNIYSSDFEKVSVAILKSLVDIYASVRKTGDYVVEIQDLWAKTKKRRCKATEQLMNQLWKLYLDHSIYPEKEKETVIRELIFNLGQDKFKLTVVDGIPTDIEKI